MQAVGPKRGRTVGYTLLLNESEGWGRVRGTLDVCGNEGRECLGSRNSDNVAERKKGTTGNTGGRPL